ncbi:FMN-binding protein [Clostridiaceae bacterium 35-E11]
MILVKEVILIKKYIAFAMIFITCFLLSCTNNVVKEVRDRFPQHEINRLSEYENEVIEGIYLVANKDQQEVVQIVNQKGFVEEIKLLISINDATNSIKEIEILKHNESHDYGALLTEAWFLNRFKNKQVDKMLEIVKMTATKDDEIVAITGATKTSQAVVDGVNRAMKNYRKIRGIVQ